MFPCCPNYDTQWFVYYLLRVSVTNLVKKTKALIQREDFPKEKPEANSYTLYCVLF